MGILRLVILEIFNYTLGDFKMFIFLFALILCSHFCLAGESCSSNNKLNIDVIKEKADSSKIIAVGNLSKEFSAVRTIASINNVQLLKGTHFLKDDKILFKGTEMTRMSSLIESSFFLFFLDTLETQDQTGRYWSLVGFLDEDGMIKIDPCQLDSVKYILDENSQ